MNKKFIIISSILMSFAVLTYFQISYFSEPNISYKDKINNNLDVATFPKSSHNPLWSYLTSSRVKVVAISSDGEYLVAGTVHPDNKIYFFNRSSFDLLWFYTTISEVDSVAISSNGSYIVACSASFIYFFNKSSSDPMWITKVIAGGVRSVAISSDGYYIAAAVGLDTSQGELYFYNKTDNTPLWSYPIGTRFQYVDISSSGDYILACTTTDLILLDKFGSLIRIFNGGGTIYAIDISSDGNHILAGFQSHIIRLYNKSSDNPYLTYDGGTSDYINSVSISSDGRYFSAGCTGNIVYLFNNTDSIPSKTFDTDSSPKVAISSDGNYTASVSLYKVYMFVNYSTTPVWSYPMPNIEYYGISIGISSNGTYIIVGNCNGIYLFHRDISGPGIIILSDGDDGDNDDSSKDNLELEPINPIAAIIGGIVALIIIVIICYFSGSSQTYTPSQAYKPTQFLTDRSRAIPSDVRRKVWQRDGGQCRYCGSTIDLEYDHIIPFSKGGSNTAKNIQILCKRCNRKKSSKIDG